MFRNHHISRYFSRVGLSKDLRASLGDSNGQSRNIVSIGAVGAFEGSPIVLSDVSEPGGYGVVWLLHRHIRECI